MGALPHLLSSISIWLVISASRQPTSLDCCCIFLLLPPPPPPPPPHHHHHLPLISNFAAMIRCHFHRHSPARFRHGNWIIGPHIFRQRWRRRRWRRRRRGCRCGNPLSPPHPIFTSHFKVIFYISLMSYANAFKAILIEISMMLHQHQHQHQQQQQQQQQVRSKPSIQSSSIQSVPFFSPSLCLCLSFFLLRSFICYFISFYIYSRCVFLFLFVCVAVYHFVFLPSPPVKRNIDGWSFTTWRETEKREKRETGGAPCRIALTDWDGTGWAGPSQDRPPSLQSLPSGALQKLLARDDSTIYLLSVQLIRRSSDSTAHLDV